MTLIRDSKTNQLVQRWIAKSNNAYILVYRRKNIDKKVENMNIEDPYLTLKDHKLEELKANNGRPAQVGIVEAEEVENENVEQQIQETPKGAKVCRVFVLCYLSIYIFGLFIINSIHYHHRNQPQSQVIHHKLWN